MAFTQIAAAILSIGLLGACATNSDNTNTIRGSHPYPYYARALPVDHFIDVTGVHSIATQNVSPSVARNPKWLRKVSLPFLPDDIDESHFMSAAHLNWKIGLNEPLCQKYPTVYASYASFWWGAGMVNNHRGIRDDFLQVLDQVIEVNCPVGVVQEVTVKIFDKQIREHMGTRALFRSHREGTTPNKYSDMFANYSEQMKRDSNLDNWPHYMAVYAYGSDKQLVQLTPDTFEVWRQSNNAAITMAEDVAQHKVIRERLFSGPKTWSEWVARHPETAAAAGIGAMLALGAGSKSPNTRGHNTGNTFACLERCSYHPDDIKQICSMDCY